MKRMNVYFSDVFGVSPDVLEEYGAFNVSVITDLPLFIDPFLLFNSEKTEYQSFHTAIIEYLRFLRHKSLTNQVNQGLLKSWYCFPEVKQNWLGFCRSGNQGSGLGKDFAEALHSNLHAVFTNFGKEQITSGSHLEKLCLIREGVGKDNISDFVTNLIKEYLLDYTQEFARKHLNPSQRTKFAVAKSRFNYKSETWEPLTFELPEYAGDYVLLTPADLLTKDDIWINKSDLERDFKTIPSAIPDEQLRAQINNHFNSLLAEDADNKERLKAIRQTLHKYPVIIDYYIKHKEDNGDAAVSDSKGKVANSKQLYIDQFSRLVALLASKTEFYQSTGKTRDEARERLLYLKHVIEKQDGYRLFYVDKEPIKREQDLQIAYSLTWFASPSDVNREVNKGRGPVDFKVSRGSKDKVLVEFKLASNTGLKRNLENQVKIYEDANQTNNSFKVIMYFSQDEQERVRTILKDLKLEKSKNIILIDARSDNKPSASKA